MRLQPYHVLKWSIFNGHGDRKKPGRLSVVTHAPTGQVYVVPHKLEHFEFVQQLWSHRGYALSDIVPSHIDSVRYPNELEEVVRVLTGLSGFEGKLKVWHPHAALERAHNRILDFVEHGELPLGDVRSEINHRYCADCRGKTYKSIPIEAA